MSSDLSASSTGVVTEFSDPSGLGVITDESGRQWPFHCVSLEDGTRTVEIGVRVSFVEGFRVARPEAVHIIRL
jgi:cold shock CspA family protein